MRPLAEAGKLQSRTARPSVGFLQDRAVWRDRPFLAAVGVSEVLAAVAGRVGSVWA